MLDYRASKLYRLLALPLRLLAWPINLALIIGSFMLTRGWTSSLVYRYPAFADYHIVTHIVLAWLTFELFSILAPIFWFGLVGWLFDKAFFFLIDVTPGEGRTYDQAVAVVKGGDMMRLLQKMDDVENWTYSDTEQFVNRLPLIRRLFYREVIILRVEKAMDLVRVAVAERGGKRLQNWEIKEVVAPAYSKVPWQEKLFGSAWFLRSAIAYLALAACFWMSYG